MTEQSFGYADKHLAAGPPEVREIAEFRTHLEIEGITDTETQNDFIRDFESALIATATQKGLIRKTEE